jgi:hypothetical protein
MFWNAIIIGAVIVAVTVASLGSRWYLGCALALLGAVLAGGLAFGAGWYYLNHYFVKPRPRHDMDFGDLGTPILCLLVIPAMSALAGLVLGVASAHVLKACDPGKTWQATAEDTTKPLPPADL